MKHNPEFDAYIAEAAAFARPLLSRIRSLFHKACPQVQEAIKWGCPHFEYKGMVGGMAAFKKHIAFGFWKGNLLSDKHNLLKGVGDTTMCRINVQEGEKLPSDKILLEYIKEAVALNEQGIKNEPRKRAPAKKEVEIPHYFWTELRKNDKALST